MPSGHNLQTISLRTLGGGGIILKEIISRPLNYTEK